MNIWLSQSEKNNIVCEYDRFSIVWEKYTTAVEDNHSNEENQNSYRCTFAIFARFLFLNHSAMSSLRAA